jgi:hypothetical protein
MPLLKGDYDRTHWEAVVRTLLERLGHDGLMEIIQYVEAEDEREPVSLKTISRAVDDILSHSTD